MLDDGFDRRSQVERYMDIGKKAKDLPGKNRKTVGLLEIVGGTTQDGLNRCLGEEGEKRRS